MLKKKRFVGKKLLVKGLKSRYKCISRNICLRIKFKYFVSFFKRRFLHILFVKLKKFIYLIFVKLVFIKLFDWLVLYILNWLFKCFNESFYMAPKGYFLKKKHKLVKFRWRRFRRVDQFVLIKRKVGFLMLRERWCHVKR